MINSYEQIFSIKPIKEGDHVQLLLTHHRGDGYVFRAIPFFQEEFGRKYILSFGMRQLRINFPCNRQSKKRYEDAKGKSFGYIHSDAGHETLRDYGIKLNDLIEEREYDCYA